MTYTIEQLEGYVAMMDRAIVRLGSIDDVDVEQSLQIARQLLDTMRALEAAQARIVKLETFDSPVVMLEHAQMKARIEAAAAIPAKPQESASDFEAIIYNTARDEFRKALEVE